MIQTFLIALREGLEMALIVAIVAGYLNRLDARRQLRVVWLATVAAIAVSVVAGVLLFALGQEFEGTREQIFEGVVMLVAVLAISWMIVWMKHHASQIRGELHTQLGLALQKESILALAAVPFVAVLREGIEASLIFLATTITTSPASALIGAFLGFGIAVIFGYLIYRGARWINLRVFFGVTGLLLIVFAAGLLAHGLHEFIEAGLVPPIKEEVWNISSILPDNSGIGEWLKGLFGYNANPSLLEVIAYPLFMAITLWYFFRLTPTHPQAQLHPRGVTR